LEEIPIFLLGGFVIFGNNDMEVKITKIN